MKIPKGPCAAALLDPQSLATGTLDLGNCGDPQLFGQTVEAVTSQTPPSNNVNVSVNVVNPTTGLLTDGPVVMTYEYSSDTHLVTAYGGESLWIYDVATTNGPELLQVSTQSGAVVNAVPMPKLYRPLLAADDGGVWVANSIQGSPGPALSYVGSGASSPTTVDPDTGSGSLLADRRWDRCVGWGGSWLELRQPGRPEVRRRCSWADLFHPRVRVHPVMGCRRRRRWPLGDAVVRHRFRREQAARKRSSPSTLILGPSLLLPHCLRLCIPNGVPTNGLVEGQGAYFDGALYILEPPFRLNGYLGYSSIVRVSVSPPAR